MTKNEVKKGMKIIIDWTAEDNYRSTRFPAIKNDFNSPVGQKKTHSISFIGKDEKNRSTTRRSGFSINEKSPIYTE